MTLTLDVKKGGIPDLANAKSKSELDKLAAIAVEPDINDTHVGDVFDVLSPFHRESTVVDAKGGRILVESKGLTKASKRDGKDKEKAVTLNPWREIWEMKEIVVLRRDPANNNQLSPILEVHMVVVQEDRPGWLAKSSSLVSDLKVDDDRKKQWQIVLAVKKTKPGSGSGKGAKEDA